MQDEKIFKVDRLEVHILPTRAQMGKACAIEAGEVLRRVIKLKGSANIIFASAPSQLEMLEGLREEKGIDWERVNAFHMDEYIGMSPDAPQSFGNYLRVHFFRKLPFRQVFYMDGEAVDVKAECERYAALLKRHPVDISFVGIGENGHLAFNDPHIADFNDPLLVKVNEKLDMTCRQQQVKDGWFKTLDDVPTSAMTITIPGLLAATDVFAVVPGPTKRDIVKKCLEGAISTECPASILRTHQSARLYLDADSAALLSFDRLKG